MPAADSTRPSPTDATGSAGDERDLPRIGQHLHSLAGWTGGRDFPDAVGAESAGCGELTRAMAAAVGMTFMHHNGVVHSAM
jgi:hypothetical protein